MVIVHLLDFYCQALKRVTGSFVSVGPPGSDFSDSIYSKFYRLFVTPTAPGGVKNVRCAFFFYFREST